MTKRQTSHAHTILINSFLFPISCVLHLPTASQLPHCIGNWCHITTDPWVLQVELGYRLELVSPPVQRSTTPLASGTSRTNLVEEEIQKLLEKGAIKKVSNFPGQFLSRIFLVPKKDGSFRPVVNLRPLNQLMERSHFKMENLGMIRDLL